MIKQHCIGSGREYDSSRTILCYRTNEAQWTVLTKHFVIEIFGLCYWNIWFAQNSYAHEQK